jgi:hypothetical protein
MTATGSVASVAGSGGAAARQVPPLRLKMPAMPSLLQSPPSSGSPAGVQAAAVTAVSPQARPAVVAPTACCVVRRLQLAPVPELV